jgi:DinB superfamily
MSETSQLVAALLEHLRLEGEEAHRRVLLLVDPLDEEQLRRRARPSAPSIGFHLWHLARWADYDAQLIDGRTQVWQQRGLALQWGMQPAGLGEAETGTEMGDEVSELSWPDKAALLGYAHEAFAARQDAIRGLVPESLLQPIHSPHISDNSKLDLLFTHLSHDNWHLGMIEAMRGFLGLRGTATR